MQKAWNIKKRVPLHPLFCLVGVSGFVCIFAFSENRCSAHKDSPATLVRVAFRLFDSRFLTSANNKSHPNGWLLLLVEVRGIEPLSEGNLTRLSPSAVCYLHSLILSRTNTLRNLVASLCMVWAKLTIRTVSTQITPEPGSWTFRGGWGLIRQPEQQFCCQLNLKSYPFYRG